MEYKICENCGAKLHVRTLKCPICNIILTEASKIITDEPTTPQNQATLETNNIENVENNINTNTIGENIDLKIPPEESTPETLPKDDVKDYVYKAEVRHSLEYTKPLSNGLKVLITAMSMVPMIGQFLGTFLGIFFATYDDNDRKSFGKALIILSILVFMFYSYSLMLYSEILSSGSLSNYLNNFIK